MNVWNDMPPPTGSRVPDFSLRLFLDPRGQNLPKVEVIRGPGNCINCGFPNNPPVDQETPENDLNMSSSPGEEPQTEKLPIKIEPKYEASEDLQAPKSEKLPERQPLAWVTCMAPPFDKYALWTEGEGLTIGRGLSSDIIIQNPKVSRAHAKLLAQEGIARLVLIGTNSVLINDERVSQRRDDPEQCFLYGIPLMENDLLGIGEVIFRLNYVEVTERVCEDSFEMAKISTPLPNNSGMTLPYFTPMTSPVPIGAGDLSHVKVRPQPLKPQEQTGKDGNNNFSIGQEAKLNESSDDVEKQNVFDIGVSFHVDHSVRRRKARSPKRSNRPVVTSGAGVRSPGRSGDKFRGVTEPRGAQRAQVGPGNRDFYREQGQILTQHDLIQPAKVKGHQQASTTLATTIRDLSPVRQGPEPRLLAPGDLDRFHDLEMKEPASNDLCAKVDNFQFESVRDRIRNSFGSNGFQDQNLLQHQAPTSHFSSKGEKSPSFTNWAKSRNPSYGGGDKAKTPPKPWPPGFKRSDNSKTPPKPRSGQFKRSPIDLEDEIFPVTGRGQPVRSLPPPPPPPGKRNENYNGKGRGRGRGRGKRATPPQQKAGRNTTPATPGSEACLRILDDGAASTSDSESSILNRGFTRQADRGRQYFEPQDTTIFDDDLDDDSGPDIIVESVKILSPRRRKL